MKLAQSIQTKQTVRLFNGKYKYKIVLVSKASSWFRGGDLDQAKMHLQSKDLTTVPMWAQRLTDFDTDYAIKVANLMKKMSDYVIRVESPYINFYTNTESNIAKLANIDTNCVKYVSYPAPGSEKNLDEKKIIVKNLDFDFRVTIGKTKQDYINFLNWCNGKDKIKLTNRAREQLAKQHSWGGYYFYVKDEKTLTMVKMFVGSCIQTVERCVKQ
jgi:hypothetical protein